MEWMGRCYGVREGRIRFEEYNGDVQGVCRSVDDAVFEMQRRA